MRQVVLSVLATIVVIALILALTFAFAGRSIAQMLTSPVSVEVETSRTEVIKSIERHEEIVLLSAATQGLHTVEKDAQIWKWDLPRSKRTNILQYSFTSKLGIDGRDVDIREIGDDHYRIIIPEFEVIGYVEPQFQTVLRDGQALSFVTEDVDTAEIITEILNDVKWKEHVDANRDLMQQQARAFYSNIVYAVDDDVQLQFEFR